MHASAMVAILCASLELIELGASGTLTTNRPYCGS